MVCRKDLFFFFEFILSLLHIIGAMSIVQSSKRPDEFPMVDSENTLTDFSSLQQQILRVPTAENNTKNESSIICVEKTTTHHSFYDVEKLAGENTANNSSIISPQSPPTSTRLLGMGNPAIIGNTHTYFIVI